MIEKVLLIMPNFNWKTEFDIQKDPPMGILYIASCIEKANLKVRIIDANAENLSMDDVITIIDDYKPDLVGISANYSPLNNLSIDLCRKIRSFSSEIIIVVGGNHATASYEYMLKRSEGSIDYIIRGQGERILLNLIKALNNGCDISSVKGIAYVLNSEVTCTGNEALIDDLDDLPLPAYHLVKMELYDRYNMITSRGCPFSCNYCASNVVHQRVRYRSPEKILQEIEFLLNNYGHKHFWFSDDTFTSNYKHTNELLDLILEKDIHFTWSCLTRVNRTKTDILKKMKAAGCKYISYGVESGDPVMINRMNKRITLDEVKEALELTKEVGIDMYTFFLIGYPGEDVESVEKSFSLIKDIRPTGVSFAVVIPLPGTTLWNYLEQNGIIDYDKIKWDYLFAKSGKNKYENYAAQLASSWCNLSEKQLIELCEKGQNLLK